MCVYKYDLLKEMNTKSLKTLRQRLTPITIVARLCNTNEPNLTKYVYMLSFTLEIG